MKNIRFWIQKQEGLVAFIVGFSVSRLVMCWRHDPREIEKATDKGSICRRNDNANYPSIELNPEIVIDEKYQILSSNSAAALLFGVKNEDMLGSDISRYLANWPMSSSEGGNSSNSRNYITTDRAGRRFGDYAFIGLHSSGNKIPISASISNNVMDGRDVRLIYLRDASTRQNVNARLARSHEELRQLSAALQTIREEERTYIARELHDDLGQLLSTLRIDLDILQQAGGNTDNRNRLIAGMRDNLARTIVSLRRIAANLRPRALDDGDLYFALRGLRDEFSSHYKISCYLYADEADLQFDDIVSTVVFRIVQEALTNIGRHAQAAEVVLNLYRIDGELLVTIRDDGRGITAEDMKKSGSLGLVGMRERVWSLNGEITVTSENPSGTSIDIVIPIAGHMK